MRATVVSSARWSSFRLSKHFIALALAAQGHDVLFVDPPVSPLSVVRSPQRRRELLGPSDERPAANLRVWHPRVLAPQSHPAVRAVNDRLIARGIARRQDPDVVLAFGLEARGVLPRLPAPRLYHCTDSIEDLPGQAGARHHEEIVIAAADAVTACSLPLTEQLRARGVDASYVPHGCDEDAFASRGEDPPELRGRPRPWVGYVGSLNFRIDADMLDAARRATGGGTLVVVGGAFGPALDPAARALLAQDDVAVLGHQPAERLPALTAALDVGLAPYGDHPFNRKSFPIKIPQYLAAGVPVVSTPNGATDELGDAVAIADDTSTFGDAVRAALAAADDEHAREARRAVARRRPWSTVANELLRAASAT